VDLSKWDTDDTAELELIHPVDGPSGVFLTVCGKNSERWKEARRAHQRRLERLVKQYRSEDRVPPEEKDIVVREWLSEMIVGWRGVEENGVPAPFDRARAAALINKADIADQMLTFVAATANFMQRSPSDS
jgi:hypothetical protein